jgi:hypothetical protein
MGKYSDLIVLKRTKARTQHTCNKCAKRISAGKIYYREHIEDKFLHALNAQKYCSSCYETYGQSLLCPSKKHRKTTKTSALSRRNIFEND